MVLQHMSGIDSAVIKVNEYLNCELEIMKKSDMDLDFADKLQTNRTVIYQLRLQVPKLCLLIL